MNYKRMRRRVERLIAQLEQRQGAAAVNNQVLAREPKPPALRIAGPVDATAADWAGRLLRLPPEVRRAAVERMGQVLAEVEQDAAKSSGK
ncbi:MAG: hypothetical protein QM765_47365 [Myxococcales bacterium]